ncbi:MAG: hypothetical protein ABL893_18850 [Hyphomicrobium sp.]
MTKKPLLAPNIAPLPPRRPSRAEAEDAVRTLLAWAGARGDAVRLATLMSAARAWRAKGDEAYCHRGLLELVMKLQRASGRMSRAQVRQWRTWLGQHRAHLVDAIWSGEDPMPTVVDSAHWVEHMVRHPRSFVRQYVLNR